MSAEVSVKSDHIQDILLHLKHFMPRGDKSLNITISVHDKKLYIACKQYMLYKAYVGVADCEDVMVSVHYHDLLPFVKNSSELTFNIESKSVTISTTSCSCTLGSSYDFDEVDFDVPEFDNLVVINNEEVFGSLRSFLKTMSLFTLYKKEHPFSIYNGVILLKTPSVLIQGRCSSLNLNAVLTSEVLRTLIELRPDNYCIQGNSMYLLSKYYACVLPVQPILEESIFVSLIPKVEPIRFQTGRFIDTLTALTVMNPEFTNFNIFKDGISVNASSAECKINDQLGLCTELVATCRIPIELLNLAFKMLGANTNAEVLFERGILCLRNQNISMLIRVLQ